MLNAFISIVPPKVAVRSKLDVHETDLPVSSAISRRVFHPSGTDPNSTSLNLRRRSAQLRSPLVFPESPISHQSPRLAVRVPGEWFGEPFLVLARCE